MKSTAARGSSRERARELWWHRRGPSEGWRKLPQAAAFCDSQDRAATNPIWQHRDDFAAFREGNKRGRASRGCYWSFPVDIYVCSGGFNHDSRRTKRNEVLRFLIRREERGGHLWPPYKGTVRQPLPRFATATKEGWLGATKAEEVALGVAIVLLLLRSFNLLLLFSELS